MSREERMNAFVSVITSLCKQRKLICELRLEIQNTSWTSIRSTDMEVQNGKMKIKYAFELEDSSDAAVSSLLSSVLGFAGMPMLYSIDIIFDFDVDHNHLLDVALHSILCNCPHITNIRLYHSEAASYHFQSDLYDHLNEDSTIITLTKYLDLLAATSSRPLLQHFNSLKLFGAKLPSTQFHHILTTSFPNIERAEWKPERPQKCYFDSRYEDEEEQEDFIPITDMDLDLTSLDHLEHFVFDLCDLDQHDNVTNISFSSSLTTIMKDLLLVN